MSAPSIKGKVLVERDILVDESNFNSLSSSEKYGKKFLIHRDGLAKVNLLSIGDDHFSKDAVYFDKDGDHIDTSLYSNPDSTIEFNGGVIDKSDGNLFYNTELDELTVTPEITRNFVSITLNPRAGTVSQTSIVRHTGELFGDLPVAIRGSSRFTFNGWVCSPYDDEWDVVSYGSRVKFTGYSATMYGSWSFEPPALTNGTLLQKVDSSGKVSYKLFKDDVWYDIPLTLSTYTGKSTTYDDWVHFIRFPKDFIYNGTTYKRADGYVLGSGYISDSAYGSGIYNVVTKTRKLSAPIAHTNATSIDGLFSSVNVPEHFGYGMISIISGGPRFRAINTYCTYSLRLDDNVFLISPSATLDGPSYAAKLKDYYYLADIYDISGTFPTTDTFDAHVIETTTFSSNQDWDHVSIDSLN